MKRTLLLTIATVLIFASWAPAQDKPQEQAPAQELKVFQDLDEVTSRIPNLPEKPFARLIEAHDGFFQDEVIIFKDVETGKEVWALSREECRDMAHTGRRPAWSANGQFISFRGNQVFLNKTKNNQLWNRTWAGYSYIANADGSQKRPLYGMEGDKLHQLNAAKYNMWDAKRPNAWYTVTGDKLWRVTIGEGVTGNKAEVIYTFPKAQSKVIQMISDHNYMLIEEEGKGANCYVINLNKEPSDEGFCLAVPLKGEVHSGSFRIHRGRPIIITGGYEQRGLGGICLRLDEEKNELVPTERKGVEGVQMYHLWNGPPDDRVGYFGKYKGKMGLWVVVPGRDPAMLADVGDGHVTWCGRDPEWFFATVGHSKAKDQQYVGKLLAGNADGKRVEIVCTPFDRQRPGAKNYGSIPLPTQSRDGTKCWFHSSMLLSTNANTGSYIAVFRRPHAPTTLMTRATDKGIALEWQPHEISHEVKGYHVYRSGDGGKTWKELTGEAIAATSYTDQSAEKNVAYQYAVTAEEWSRLESDRTSPSMQVELSVEDGTPTIAATGGNPKGITGWDKTAPASAKDFQAQLKDGLIHLTWEAPADKDRRYYNVYASSEGKPAIEQKRLLVSPTHGQTLYIDWTAPKGKAMHYAITVIDRQGNESQPVYASCEAPASP
jgi:hypothetical protein